MDATPLVSAARNGEIAGIRAALAREIPVDAADGGRETALQAALTQRQMLAAEYLLSVGANPNGTVQLPHRMRVSLLAFAILWSTPDAVALLLEHGARIDHRDPPTPPLHFAALHYRDAVVKMLLERGAPVDARDHEGNTALFVAVGQNPLPPENYLRKMAALNLLVEAGADPRAVCSGSRTPLEKARAEGTKAEVMLLEHGVELTRHRTLRQFVPKWLRERLASRKRP